VRSSLGPITARQAAGNGNGSRHRHQPSPLQAVVGGPDWDADSLRPLYHKYLEALREHGKDTEDVSFTNFSRQIVRKADAVKNRSSCDAVRLRLTIEEGRVLFKARPLRRRKKTS
jgi:hypothetical protein